MIFVDTAFVIAWISPRDDLHEKALSLLDSHRNDDWLTTDCVLLEVGNSLAKRYRAEAIETIENFLTDELITIVGLKPDLFARAFELYRSRQDKPWGLIDCVSFMVMRDYDVREALTNDRNFVQAGFAALMRSD